MADEPALRSSLERLQAAVNRERAVSNALRGLSRVEGLSDAVLTCVRGATAASGTPIGCGALFMRSPVDGSVVEASSHLALPLYVAELEAEKRLTTAAAAEAAAAQAAAEEDALGDAVDDRPCSSPEAGADDEISVGGAAEAIGCGDGGSTVASTADADGTARSTGTPAAHAPSSLKRGGSFLVGGAKASTLYRHGICGRSRRWPRSRHQQRLVSPAAARLPRPADWRALRPHVRRHQHCSRR